MHGRHRPFSGHQSDLLSHWPRSQAARPLSRQGPWRRATPSRCAHRTS
jgi:hypothetical protein